METNRRSPNSSGYSRMVLVLAILFVAGSFAFVAASIRNTFFSNGAIEASVPPERALPSVDMNALMAHLKSDQDYLKSVEAAAIAEYERRNQRAAGYFSNGETAVRLFVRVRIGGDQYGECILQNADAYAHAAWLQGCRDPLILAICDVYSYSGFYPNNTEGAKENLDHVFALRDSNYPAICKLGAIVTGLANLGSIAGSAKVRSKDGMDAVLAKSPDLLEAALNQCAALLQTNIPMPVFAGEVMAMYSALEDSPPQFLPRADEQIESLLKGVSSSGAFAPVLHADFLISWAWAARGSGWADSVTDEGAANMEARLKLAQETLEAAYARFPTEVRIPTLMINVELGQGQGRDRMEMWFQRAMADDPGWCLAYNKKMYYLQPKWYGSASDVLSFGDQCIKTDLWSANVPLVCSDGIVSLANYDTTTYQNDRAWALMKRACEGYLDHYPFSIRTRSTLVRYAAKAGKWDIVKEQMKLLDGKWDFDVADSDELNNIKKSIGE